MARPLEVERKWYVVDAEGKHPGRLATEIVRVLRGKNKPQYTPHVDVGDFVVVVNADRVVVTGRKAEQRVYRRHSGYPGGMKETSYEQMLARKPTEVLRKAVYGMMPKTRLARKQFKKLKIYAGPEHPHAAQDPQTLEVK
ncbi:MAG TPA: 50S ribosomal protein L13 [Rubrobacter sp.]